MTGIVILLQAWWATTDDGKMLNWGGVETGEFGCTCFKSGCKYILMLKYIRILGPIELLVKMLY